ncbi:uncharacterized protein LOC133711820 [Rosa rugosa]|uniref:uncharacterized protein LOC133711820 n=1 Tax=Rosa rugosa TaxID=74645 RepID=UPI002B4112C6|nr:uncharacterized protein LOC133711820 [Rosa rugosa]
MSSRREREVPGWADPPIRKAKQRPDDLAEDQLREIYTLVPVAGPLNNKKERKKWFKVFCNVCKKFNGRINCDRLQDYDYLQHHAAIIHGENETKMEEDKHDEDTSMVPGSSSDFSEGQLRKIYDLVPEPGPADMLEDKEPIKWFTLVCELCASVVGCIQEGSNLQDCRATHQHASIHRDVLLDLPTGINQCHEDTSMAPRPIPYHSEAELLRIYSVRSYTTGGFRRSAEPPSEEPVVVWYAVACKLCLEVEHTTQDYPSLQDSHWLQKHALTAHSEYLSMDGPTVPDLEDFNSEQVIIGYEGPDFFLGEDDAHLQEGFVKVCRMCHCENCSSGVYRSHMMYCDVCNESGTHLSWNCPTGNWELGQPTPCNRSN